MPVCLRVFVLQPILRRNIRGCPGGGIILVRRVLLVLLLPLVEVDSEPRNLGTRKEEIYFIFLGPTILRNVHMTFNFHLDVLVQEPRPPVCLFLLEAEPHITLPHLVFTSVLVNRQEEFDDEVVPVVCDFDGNFVVNCRLHPKVIQVLQTTNEAIAPTYLQSSP